MKEKTQIKVTYDIQIGPYDLRLNQEEAESLFAQLKIILKKEEKKWPDNYPPMRPYIPSDPIVPQTPRDNDWLQPHTPTWPPYGPPIWCQSPTSTCNS